MGNMLTYQDYEGMSGSDEGKIAAVKKLIEQHRTCEICETARVADLYDAQRNKTIEDFVRKVYNANGMSAKDYTAYSNRIASNFFRRLNKQRCTYSLGNGVTFYQGEDASRNDEIKALLGEDFDTDIFDAAYKALIHGVCYVFYDLDHIHAFQAHQFAPLWDEMTGALRAGVRYWRIAPEKPAYAVLYEEDGFAVYRAESGEDYKLYQSKRAYKLTVAKAPIEPEATIVGGENYGALPIVPLWGSNLHQSTLVGMRQAIDAYDLIRSGFADDLQDCAQIYWLIENYGGMSDEDLERFRDKLKFMRIAEANTQDGGKITPYTQEPPYAARVAFLQQMRAGIYEDFGGLDVTNMASGNRTATEINAAYQPLDESADDFEYCVTACIRQLLKLAGVEGASPTYKRNRISNQSEQVEMVMAEANYLDDQTVLELLPNISPDMVQAIMERRDAQSAANLSNLDKLNQLMREDEDA